MPPTEFSFTFRNMPTTGAANSGQNMISYAMADNSLRANVVLHDRYD